MQTSPRAPDQRIPTPPWFLVVGAWSILGLVGAFTTYAFWQMGNRSFSIWRAIASEAPRWFAYALLTPVVFWAAYRFPLRAPRLGRHFMVHVGLALGSGMLYSVAAAFGISEFSPTLRPTPAARLFLNSFLGGLPATLPLYFGVLAVAIATHYAARHRDAELRSVRLGAQLTDARMTALRMQLHPHFLFNSLNTITVFARDNDSATVVRMLELLGETLRATLRADPRHEVPLGEEIAFVRRYLEIERVRFSDRLQTRIELPDDLTTAMVPAFVLQPLVENAIRHGIAARVDAGTLAIEARRAGNALELVVRDDGAGLHEHWETRAQKGVGLSNTRERLATLYGDAASLSLAHDSPRGAVATVRLPFSVSGHA